MGFDSREYEYADVHVSILGVELTGLRGLVYKKKQEKEVLFGQGADGKGIQRGNKNYDGTLMLLKSDYDILDAAAVAAGFEDLIDVPGKFITITCVYLKPEALALSTDTLVHLEFTEAEDGMKQGDKFKEISLPFLFLRKVKV
ncbi:hypothetical protein SAMN05428988_1313 [Chitinophaga sp. YR573]|uniref:hypothetical protein n=1 Tax=Chitinophaga sp. YR573 TaxID=1881040 RepID=UPI0008D04F8A|nr:hypothetical protein [Chitinophaga sp. YR573]SEW01929.1 hypothetical protein SAMN05428988_1313 [Chitinophaga sp. YR573]